VTRTQPTDVERAFIGPYLPSGEHAPYPERLRQRFKWDVAQVVAPTIAPDGELALITLDLARNAPGRTWLRGAALRPAAGGPADVDAYEPG
jgi:hypothetical protein